MLKGGFYSLFIASLSLMFSRLADRIFAWPEKRGARWIILIATLLVLAAAGPLIGQFESSQRNDQLDFLPKSSQSVVVAKAQQKLGDDGIAAVVAISGKVDKATIGQVKKTQAELAGEGFPFLAPPVVSPDKRVVIFSNEIPISRESSELRERVKELSDTVHKNLDQPGREVAISGPAGSLADALEIFGSIDSTLLLFTAALVFVLLLLIYRSPIFWAIPLATVGVAEGVARASGTLLAESGFTVSGQAAGIMSVLVFGAGTDYALLLVARYREELHRHSKVKDAVAVALRQTAPTILASAATVIAGLLCLSVASLEATAGLGPAGALGVAAAALSSLIVLPALLLIGGRKAFWPFIPRLGGKGSESGPWMAIARRLQRRPRPYWISSLAILLILASGLVFLNNDLTSADSFRKETESAQGQKIIASAFPAGAAKPADILVLPGTETKTVERELKDNNLVAAVRPVDSSPEVGTLLAATLKSDPGSKEAYRDIDLLRQQLNGDFAGKVFVGGSSAQEADLRKAVAEDNKKIIPLIVIVVFLILVLLLRALVLPLLLMITVLISFAASLGVTAVVFSGAPGLSPSLPLYAFVFLVALGVDYNIFLAARTREERLSGKSTSQSMLISLAVTGAVITSAGIVLAGTFAILGVLPIWDLTQIGFAVAFGVLLDTFLVRSILVPSLTFSLKEKVWLPSSLAAAKGLTNDKGTGNGGNEVDSAPTDKA